MSTTSSKSSRGIAIPINLTFALLIACASSGFEPPPISDFHTVQALRDLEENATALMAQARFEASDPRLRELVDQFGHEHTGRAERLKRWIELYFPGTAAVPAELPCGTEDFGRIPTGSGELDRLLVERLIRHRQCALQLLEPLEQSKSESTRSMAEDVCLTFSREIETLRQLQQS